MQSKLDALEDKNVIEKISFHYIHTINSFEILIIQDKWTKKFSDLEAENEKLKTAKLQQDEQFQYLKSQIISHPKFSSISAGKEVDGQFSRVLTSPPTSCQDLKNRNGKVWPIDGIHLLKINNTIQAALCTFANDDSSGNIY